MAVEIREVKTNKDIKEFIEFPLRMYKDNPYFVPPLYSDEKAIFKKNNSYSDTCISAFFLASKDKKTVGRIQGIIQKQSNELKNEKRVRFTRFDSVDDDEVAKALFDAVENWAKVNGMDTVCGPLSYSDLEREGLLIEGFDYISTFEEQYNHPYYATLIENRGYVKEVDWIESRLYAPKEKNLMLEKVAERVLELNKLHVIDSSKYSKKEYIEKYKDGVFECLDICYSELYGVVPFTENMKKQIIDNFMLIINKKYLIIICDENDKVVSFALCLPGMGEALQKSGGRLTPPALVRLLKAINKPKVVDLALVGILPEYQITGVTAVMLEKMISYLESGEIEYFETNLNLEDNKQILAQWKYFDQLQHKRRRSYIKKI